MEGKPLVQSFGTALLLLAVVAAETFASGAANGITQRLAEVGFALFATRALLAMRPLQAWLGGPARALRWVAVPTVALFLLVGSFWAAVLALGILVAFGGTLVVEFVDDAARLVARPPAFAARRPLAAGATIFGVALVVAFAHDILARGLYLVKGDTPLALAFGTATFGLYAACLALAALLVAATLGRGRDALPRRMLYAIALAYPLAWLFGYHDADALSAREASAVPLLALAIAGIEFAEILFEAPERASRRALPRAALWDAFLALAFGALLLLSVFGIGGQSGAATLFQVKAAGWVGLVVGALLVPLGRLAARRAAARASASADAGGRAPT